VWHSAVIVLTEASVIPQFRAISRRTACSLIFLWNSGTHVFISTTSWYLIIIKTIPNYTCPIHVGFETCGTNVTPGVSIRSKGVGFVNIIEIDIGP